MEIPPTRARDSAACVGHGRTLRSGSSNGSKDSNNAQATGRFKHIARSHTRALSRFLLLAGDAAGSRARAIGPVFSLFSAAATAARTQRIGRSCDLTRHEIDANVRHEEDSWRVLTQSLDANRENSFHPSQNHSGTRGITDCGKSACSHPPSSAACAAAESGCCAWRRCC